LIYDQAYAAKYRAHDETLADSAPYLGFVDWLQDVCGRFTPPIDALELGCGTGRYFRALRGVRHLTGLDASADMLALAKTPYHSDEVTVEQVTLVHGDLLTQDFPAESFDLVYAIGVLAEHVPLAAGLAVRVHGWLKAGGRFAFSTVHPHSNSIPKTLGRRAGGALVTIAPAPLRDYLRRRLLAGGRYADEGYIREVLDDLFVEESMALFVSEAHLHCLCVARKAA
jgi:SAM-dependent methyltransferase